jgi:hypothetical protein
MVLDDANVEQIMLCQCVCKTKILCTIAAVCLTRIHKEEHGKYLPMDDIKKSYCFMMIA